MTVSARSLHELAEIGQVMAGFAAVAGVMGVFFVWQQVKQSAQNSGIELVTGMTTLMLTVDQAFIEYPTLRRYFHTAATPSEESELERARAVAMALANALDHVVEHMGLMKTRTQTAWCEYIAEVWETSGVFKELLDDHEGWWPGLQEHVRAIPPTPAPASADQT